MQKEFNFDDNMHVFRLELVRFVNFIYGNDGTRCQFLSSQFLFEIHLWIKMLMSFSKIFLIQIILVVV